MVWNRGQISIPPYRAIWIESLGTSYKDTLIPLISEEQRVRVKDNPFNQVINWIVLV